MAVAALYQRVVFLAAGSRMHVMENGNMTSENSWRKTVVVFKRTLIQEKIYILTNQLLYT